MLTINALGRPFYSWLDEHEVEDEDGDVDRDGDGDWAMHCATLDSRLRFV